MSGASCAILARVQSWRKRFGSSTGASAWASGAAGAQRKGEGWPVKARSS